jgi:predicted dehydrogenase
MTYKSVILGCGPRAEIHMAAYEGLKEIRLSAVCDRDAGRLKKCGEKYGIPALYSNFEEMLEKEKPDILHIVTPPNFREQPIAAAAGRGVKGIIVEKPVALNYKQIQEIRRTADKTGVKIAVNTQRRYFETCRSLKSVLDAKKIGGIQFIRCVTKGNILSMGPHMTDLLLYFLNDSPPESLWAAAEGMNGYDYGHPAPANMLFRMVFPGGVTVYGEDAENAVGTAGEPEFWQHLELDIWGSRGRAWWRQNSDWGYHAEGMKNPAVKDSKWEKSDVPGQRDFTRAMALWLDGKEPHLNCLDNALRGFDVIMALMRSAYIGKELPFPCEADDETPHKLEKKLKENSKICVSN